ncbi:MAG: hypothetical protein P1U56_09150 [Saprospiraceae bacterium]|nr:hypothetical protein [Saprospiraceae bacterium]
MKQITKITIVLAFIISLASCQSSKTGCYDFGTMELQSQKNKTKEKESTVQFTSAVCKP